MAPNPCCCFTLQTGTRIVGIVQIVGGIIGFVLWISTLILIREQLKRHNVEFDLLPLIIFGILLLGVILGVMLGILVLLAANQRSVRKCRIWLNIMIVLTVLYVVGMAYNAWTMGFAFVPLTETIVVFVNIYMMWTVCAFMQEVDSCPKLLPKSGDDEE